MSWFFPNLSFYFDDSVRKSACVIYLDDEHHRNNTSIGTRHMSRFYRQFVDHHELYVLCANVQVFVHLPAM